MKHRSFVGSVLASNTNGSPLLARCMGVLAVAGLVACGSGNESPDDGDDVTDMDVTTDAADAEDADVEDTDIADDVADVEVDNDPEPDTADVEPDTSVDPGACEAWCERATACTNDYDSIDECMPGCLAEFDESDATCADATIAVNACLGTLTCGEYRDWYSGVDGYACALDDIEYYRVCGGTASRCEAVCELVDGYACSRDRLRVRVGVSELELSPDSGSIAIRVDGDEVRRLADRLGDDTVYNIAQGVIVTSRSSTDSHMRFAGVDSTALPVYRTGAGQRVIVTGDIIVRTTANADRVAASVGGAVVRGFSWDTDLHVIHVSPNTWFDAIDKLRDDAQITFAEPDLLRSYEPRVAPDDPYYSRQWHLNGGTDENFTATHVNAESAWEITRGSPRTIVAINDDGVDLSHPDFDFLAPMNTPELPEDGCCIHGTAVAGVASATGFNGEGVSGVCAGCSTLPVFTNLELEADSGIADSLAEPAARGAAVINNSWGPADGDYNVVHDPVGDPLSDPLASVVDDAIRFAYNDGRDGLGTILLFAAGNGNEDTASDPFASHALTIAVAAVDDSGRKSGYSDFGDAVELSAPSDGGSRGIFTADILGGEGYNPGSVSLGDQPGDYTNDFGGTSAATPVVAGVIGLMVDANPTLEADAIREILRRTARRIDVIGGAYDGGGRSPYYGFGMVDAYAAVRDAAVACTPLDREICNGFDDTCEGDIDEDCVVGGSCASCSDDAQCTSGACTVLAGEQVCLLACSQGCDVGTECQGSLCVPVTGTCGACVDEVCNGFDDDCDGTVDNGVCDLLTSGEDCSFDAECESGCVDGYCGWGCSTGDDCDPGEICAVRSDRYGQPTDVRICVYSDAPCAALVCDTNDTDALACLESALDSAGWICTDFEDCLTE